MWNAHFPVGRQAESNQVCQCVKIAWPFFSRLLLELKHSQNIHFTCAVSSKQKRREGKFYICHIFFIVLCTPTTRLLPCCCRSSIVNVNTQAKRKKKMFKNSKHKKVPGNETFWLSLCHFMQSTFMHQFGKENRKILNGMRENFARAGDEIRRDTFLRFFLYFNGGTSSTATADTLIASSIVWSTMATRSHTSHPTTTLRKLQAN